MIFIYYLLFLNFYDFMYYLLLIVLYFVYVFIGVDARTYIKEHLRYLKCCLRGANKFDLLPTSSIYKTI